MKAPEGNIHVFVLISQKNGRFFFGQTIDIRRALAVYNLGKSDFTRINAPLALFASKAFENRTDAMKMEQELRKRKSEDDLLRYLFYNSFVINDDRK